MNDADEAATRRIVREELRWAFVSFIIAIMVSMAMVQAFRGLSHAAPTPQATPKGCAICPDLVSSMNGDNCIVGEADDAGHWHFWDCDSPTPRTTPTPRPLCWACGPQEPLYTGCRQEPCATPTPTPCYRPGSLQVPCNAKHLTPAEKLKRDRTTLGRVYEGPRPKVKK